MKEENISLFYCRIGIHHVSELRCALGVYVCVCVCVCVCTCVWALNIPHCTKPPFMDSQCALRLKGDWRTQVHPGCCQATQETSAQTIDPLPNPPSMLL